MAEDVRVRLRFGDGEWVESVCPTPEGQYVLDAKARRRARSSATSAWASKRWQLEARGVEDESAGYHPRHTVWSWSAGVGELDDGRSVGWNLVERDQRPPERSERAIWVDGEPSEPGPVEFDGLEAIVFDDGARLDFAAEAERRRDENKLLSATATASRSGRSPGALAGRPRAGERPRRHGAPRRSW